jgi:hypothetical protein
LSGPKLKNFYNFYGKLFLVPLLSDIIKIRCRTGSEKMSNYYLFLDESKIFGNLKYFVLAGYIINSDEYNNRLIPMVNSLKNGIYGNSDIILHESEIRAHDKSPYDILKDQSLRNEFWNQLSKIFSDIEFSTIGVGVDIQKLSTIYSNNHLNNEYSIALQVIIENFVHFLELNDGYGSTYIESTNNTDDKKLTNVYYNMIATGSLFINKYCYQKRLATINFLMKSDNNIGLQIADFIPSALNRKYSGCKNKNPSLTDMIVTKLYAGGCNKPDNFGFKIL